MTDDAVSLGPEGRIVLVQGGAAAARIDNTGETVWSIAPQDEGDAFVSLEADNDIVVITSWRGVAYRLTRDGVVASTTFVK